ncbi:succinylglutamate desuccinylase/aspartoacylase domain-containing protein [Nannocystis bainbridge]|uniref:Succinylglutamate desuccinylase/aspartoacylase family protein n=1 Tax=Nannocystis bainbridge TaxID=2995303 RepID=A0ABT5DY13_9BACT|nr:succinylglutamate desuccinylase/aspartoacylase family protein [Nannocystis bainbridge]MDC0718512.1 succinylglutamate desuccinylase/aspartoacylase family protein [Nannocystis bainbridge]
MSRLSPGVHWFSPTLPIHVFDAAEPGPVALIQAGIHGDEVAGVHALQEMLEEHLRPSRGRLIVVPVMNPPAYRARQRSAPGGLDLNRCFPGDVDAPERERQLARRFMDLVLAERPTLMATLHESHKRYHPDVKPSFGQTLVYGVEPMPAIIARTIDRLNARIAGEDERWAPQYYPVATSSTEVIVEATGCVGICVETWMGLPESRRIELQRLVVELLLDDLGVRPMA